MWYVAWPVLITQVWGLVEQSKLDDRALNIAKGVVAGGSPVAAAHDSKRFCTACGKENSATARFCSACGNPLQ
jgi:NADH pyrophosphatase NudC (nudix superfamily)